MSIAPLTSLEKAEEVRRLGRVPVGTAVVLTGDDGIVVILRQGAHGEGTWSFPGGWVDPGEDPKTAAARETWEEIGVTVIPEDLLLLGYTHHVYPEGVEDVCLWFLAEGYTGTVRAAHPEKIAEVRVVEAISDMPFPRFLSIEKAIEKGILGGL